MVLEFQWKQFLGQVMGDFSEEILIISLKETIKEYLSRFCIYSIIICLYVYTKTER